MDSTSTERAILAPPTAAPTCLKLRSMLASGICVGLAPAGMGRARDRFSKGWDGSETRRSRRAVVTCYAAWSSLPNVGVRRGREPTGPPERDRRPHEFLRAANTFARASARRTARRGTTSCASATLVSRARRRGWRGRSRVPPVSRARTTGHGSSRRRRVRPPRPRGRAREGAALRRRGRADRARHYKPRRDMQGMSNPVVVAWRMVAAGVKPAARPRLW